MHRRFFLMLCFSSLVFAQTQVAVVEFQGKGVSNLEASALTDRLVLELFKTNSFKVLEREMLEKILEEQKFQLSGCNSTECLIEIGRLANVQEIISGSVSKVGEVYSISARLISVESGEILKVAAFDYRGNLGNLLITGMSEIAKQLAGIVSSNVDVATKTKLTLGTQNIARNSKLQLVPKSSSIQNSFSRAERLAEYDKRKKSPNKGVWMSMVLPSSGHFYAGKPAKGIVLGGIRIALLGTAFSKGFQTNEYGYTEVTPAYYIGWLGYLVFTFWEMGDAMREINLYNEEIYKTINE